MTDLSQLSYKLFWFFAFSFLFALPQTVAQAQQEIRIAANAGPEGDAVKQLAKDYPGGAVKVIELPYDTLRQQLIAQLSQTSGNFDVVMLD